MLPEREPIPHQLHGPDINGLHWPGRPGFGHEAEIFPSFPHLQTFPIVTMSQNPHETNSTSESNYKVIFHDAVKQERTSNRIRFLSHIAVGVNDLLDLDKPHFDGLGSHWHNADFVRRYYRPSTPSSTLLLEHGRATKVLLNPRRKSGRGCTGP